MDVVTERLAGQYKEDKEYGAAVVPMREAVAGDFRTPIIAFSGALAFALLLLCINISYLRRVHLEARRKEIALRLALGAGRTVLMRQLLKETLLLFGIGGAIGILFSPLGVRLLLSFVPAAEIPWLHAPIDGLVVLGTVAFTLLAAVLSGLFPVMEASRSDLARLLGSGRAITGSAGIGRRLRGSIIVPQIALALVPLCGAGLLIRSFVRLQEVPLGFAPEHRLTLALSAPKAHYVEARGNSRPGKTRSRRNLADSGCTSSWIGAGNSFFRRVHDGCKRSRAQIPKAFKTSRSCLWFATR